MTRKQPVPAPHGTHWVITESAMGINGVPALEIGLWPEDVTPSRHGWARGPVPEESLSAFDAEPSMIFPLASDYFTRTRQIRRASKRALRQYNAKQAYTNLANTLYEEATA